MTYFQRHANRLMRLLLLAMLLFCPHRVVAEEAHSNAWEDAQPMPDNLGAIFDEDVFRHFDLEKEYDTELKRRIFKRSDDYATKLSELKRLKSSAQSTTFRFGVCPGDEEGAAHTCTEGKFLQGLEISDYDVTTSQFKITIPTRTIGSYSDLIEVHDESRTNGRQVYLELPILRKENRSGYSYSDDSYLIFPMKDEQTALFIEQHRQDIALQFLFTIIRVDSIKSEYGKSPDEVAVGSVSELRIFIDSDHKWVRSIKTDVKKKSNEQKP